MAKKRAKAERFFTNGHSNFAAIFFDMMDSKAWSKLNGNAVLIYLLMRRKYSVKVANGIMYDSNANDISVPKSEYIKYMGQAAFETAIDQLIDFGFIKVIEYKVLRGPNKVIIYGFNDMWLNYGEKAFNIKEEWRRSINRNSV